MIRTAAQRAGAGLRASGPFVGRSPLAAGALGVACTASSGVFVTLSRMGTGPVVLYRFVYALPVLLVLGGLERRTSAQGEVINHATAVAAGVFFAVDFLAYTRAISYAGAGIATVLSNLQVLFVGVTAWLLWGHVLHRRLAAAVALIVPGVALTGGLIGFDSHGGGDAVGVLYGLGSSLAYAAFLLLFRHAIAAPSARVRGLLEVTAVAAVVTLPFAIFGDQKGLVPSWPAHGWVASQACVAQVAGWLLLAVAIPRFSPVLGSLLLLLQPVTAVLLAAAVLGEIPSVAQALGCALIVVAVGIATVRAEPSVSGRRVLANG